MLTKLNYELAISQAKKLESAASECREMIATVQKQIAAIQQSWTGEAADAMVEKLHAWVKDTTQSANTLDSLAARVKQKADLLRAIDEGNGSAFGSGSGGGGIRGNGSAFGEGKGGGGTRF